MTGCCFVTCGATVPFPELVECVLSTEVLTSLNEEGYNRLVVQFGKGYSEEFKRRCIGLGDSFKIHEVLQDGVDLRVDSAVEFRSDKPFGFEIIGFPYSNDIVSLLDQHADVVISHAGTGSILDSLRLNKPLIVVVNHTLMDNHQQQTADKFEELGHVISISPEKAELCKAIDSLKGASLRPLRNEPNKEFLNRLKNIVY
ncbi:UDP-N-acetylglucosamine transferase subunit ALG13 [Nakaseomyces bracarensis]|uniref:UDP-N-acetylglucosamine transferase subunit ALG13 n=1 Tax=Nakaseomyces bracarensis TaxID=273131 RepID=A0ABR4NNE3_9SACH